MKKYILPFLLLPCLLSCGTQESSTKDNTPGTSAAAQMSAGQQLFVNNCAQCHSMKEDRTGPKLEGVLVRWNNDTTRVRAFIRNSQEVIAGDDAYATQLYHKWGDVMMPPFTSLSDGEINEIVDYLSHPE